MKHSLLLLALCLLGSQVWVQLSEKIRNALFGVAPHGVLNKFRRKIEFMVSEHQHSIGAFASLSSTRL